MYFKYWSFKLTFSALKELHFQALRLTAENIKMEYHTNRFLQNYAISIKYEWGKIAIFMCLKFVSTKNMLNIN